jgi:predicted membrane channel-forming protein YqfA (hemolysin III family)
MVNLKASEIADWYGHYRSPRRPWAAAVSALEWHNETLNIHTHLLPGLVWLYMLFNCIEQEYYQRSPPLIQYIIHFAYFGGAFMGLASAFAHTFHIVDGWSLICRRIDYRGVLNLSTPLCRLVR